MSFSSLRSLTFLLSYPMITALMIMGLTPVLSPIGSKYEGKFLPVVENVKVQSVRTYNQGMTIRVEMDKIRDCDIEAVFWNDSSGNNVLVFFPENFSIIDDKIVIHSRLLDPISRPSGARQNAGEWFILNLFSLHDTESKVIHRCHPFWLTYTNFYPPGDDT